MSKKTIIIAIAVILILSVFSFSGCSKKPSNQFVTIGTGGVTGVYYPTRRCDKQNG